MLGWLRHTLLALLIAAAGTASAQQVGTPVLVVDSDTVFANSLYGVSLVQKVQAAGEALIAENKTIEDALAAEEKALTDARPTLEVEEFRRRAEAFDVKVTAARAEQDRKAREVQAMTDTGRQEFQGELTQALAQIARERGALVVMERQQVFLSAESIDVTNEAVRRLNAALSAPGTPEPAPTETPPAPSADQ